MDEVPLAGPTRLTFAYAVTDEAVEGTGVGGFGMRGTLSKEQLLEKYADPDWRAAYVRASALTELLRNCILRRGYKLADRMISALAFTPYGIEIRDNLITKQKVPAKEAKMLCFLALAHQEPLIDLLATNLEEVADSVHQQIRNRDILFPFMHGRELYERAAELFEDERRHLTYDETLKLLDTLPQGVYQMANYVTGPYGLLESRVSRQFGASHRVPMYTCAEITCNAVHMTLLSTNREAPVNEHQPKMSRLLESKGQSWAWGSFLVEIEKLHNVQYDDKSLWAILLAIGDCLALSELRSLFSQLMDSTHGEFRSSISGLGISGDSTKAAENLSRAQMMQLLYLVDERMIAQQLDSMIYSQHIRIPSGEIRRPVVSASYGFGTFSLGCEMSEYGFRIDSLSSEIAPLRLRRLVDKVYPDSDQKAIDELDWQLRDVDGESVVGRLEEYLRIADPREVVQRLLLSRRESFNATCDDLGLDRVHMATESLAINASLWKLGFNTPGESDFNADFWQSHERLKNAAATLRMSAVVDQRHVGELAYHYFRDLEGVLDDALAFATWALTTDHLLTSDPFSYSASADRIEAYARLSKLANEAKEDDVRFGEKNTLYPLCRGFSLLADHLGRLQSEENLHRRASEAYPKYVKYTELKRFPFEHNVAFLDLTADSRQLIMTALAEVSQHLLKADAPRVRNEHVHFRRSTADLDALANCLSEVEVAVRRLEACGFSRILFRQVARESDRWGRTICRLSDVRNRDIIFRRPSPYTWISMPRLSVPQYLMLSAKFAEPNEMLRLVPKVDSQFVEMWAGFPRRRKASSKSVESEAHVEQSPATVGADVG